MHILLERDCLGPALPEIGWDDVLRSVLAFSGVPPRAERAASLGVSFRYDGCLHVHACFAIGRG